jgi:hypothetical protein
MKVGIARERSGQREILNYADMWRLVSQVQIPKRKPVGDGTRDSPYEPQGLSDWFWLAQQPLASAAMCMRVGNRVIARWGHDAGGLKSYTSDVTDFPDITREIAVGKEIRTDAGLIDAEAGIRVQQRTIYTRKAERVEFLDDHTIARMARELIAINHRRSEPYPASAELANTICGLLVAECGVHRAQAASASLFVTTLMLLDLIERSVTYGRHGQRYTWASMLMHGNSKTGDVTPNNISGRHANGDDQAKHPMAGAGTVKFAKQMNNLSTNNPSRNRVISVCSSWLANHLAEHAEQSGSHDIRHLIIRQNAKTWTGVPNTSLALPTTGGLRQLAEIALQLRARGPQCLLTGHKMTSIVYAS